MTKQIDPIEKINEDAGKVIAFSGKGRPDKIEVLPTGILPLDLLIGVGGIPKGRITEIHGLPSTGKTTLCLYAVKAAQARGIKCGYIDAEYSFNFEHARGLGVDTDKLTIVQPDSGEEGFEAMDTLVRSGVGLIIVDSVSGLVPRSLIEAEAGKPPMGAQARLVGQSISKLVGPVSKNNAIIIFINQLRQNIMGGTYDPYMTPGGLALRFYTSLRLDIRKGKAIKKGDEIIGYTVRVKIAKNKVAIPGNSCEFPYLHGKGFIGDGDVLEMAVKKELVTREGNSYFYKGKKIAAGKENSREAIENDPELKEAILSQLFPTTSDESN